MTTAAKFFEMRRLGVDDASAFSALRRAVTQDNPVPMGLSYEDELTRTLESFRAQLSAPLPNAVFGAFLDGDLVATAAVSRYSPFASTQHKMVMWGVFTSPQHRRQGFSRAIVEFALTHAFRSGANRVNLQVYVPNIPAMTLYHHIGFREFGTEPDAVYINGHYHEGIHMSLPREEHRMSASHAE